MTKQITDPLSCITSRTTTERLSSRIGSIHSLILFMASWCLTVTVSAQGVSSVPASEMHEMNLTTEDRQAIAALANSYSEFALAGDVVKPNCMWFVFGVI